MKININDLSGHTFHIGLRKDIVRMKHLISFLSDDKLENEFYLENNLTNHDNMEHFHTYLKSDYNKRALVLEGINTNKIEVIYNGIDTACSAIETHITPERIREELKAYLSMIN